MSTMQKTHVLALHKACQALKLIERVLESFFPGTRFRLRARKDEGGRNTIGARIEWTDGPAEESVRQAVAGIAPEKPEIPGEPPVHVEFARTETAREPKAGVADNVIPFRPRGRKQP